MVPRTSEDGLGTADHSLVPQVKTMSPTRHFFQWLQTWGRGP